jgi:uncharacterized membrane protein YgcG
VSARQAHRARWIGAARLALLALAAAVASATVAAQERITEFRSEVSIGADGTLTVIETITVQAEGQSIRRGILREFPTEYRDRAGNRVTVPFEVDGVTRNEVPERWQTERLDNGVRVRIGDPDVLLVRGPHRYRITYRTARQIGFFAQHDELYWNVTGNGWTFAIDRASARVRLPRPVPAAALAAEAYTGPQGAQGTDWRAQVADGTAEYETTLRLAPREGLTIVLSFPKGIVAAPSTLQRIGWFIDANKAAGVGGIGVLFLIGWLYSRWRRFGRDPKPGPLFPRYDPPAGLGPAAVRYLDRMRFDSRCFAAGVLGLGARGYLKVEQRGETFNVERTATSVDWLPGERPLADALFATAPLVRISKTYDPQIGKAQQALDAALKRHCEGRLFVRNRGTMVAAVGVALAIGAACLALDASPAVLVAVVVALVITLLAFGRWMPAYTEQGRRLKDDVEGLRQYLGVAERDSLARLQAPELTPQEFSRQLPYALALGVEKTWADRFAAVAGSAAVAAAVAGYYHANSFDGSFSSVGDLGDSLGALGSTVSAAASPPGSSSGSGGGGSSGGGGGGGGGSGW